MNVKQFTILKEKITNLFHKKTRHQLLTIYRKQPY